jgi:hypothetical protein
MIRSDRVLAADRVVVLGFAAIAAAVAYALVWHHSRVSIESASHF